MKAEIMNVQVRIEPQSDTDTSEKETIARKRISIVDPENDEVPVPRLHAKTFLIIFAVALIYFTQVLNIVGAGSLTPAVGQALGGSANGVWLSQSITILTVVLCPPISQAADYWGRRWFLIILTFFGAAGSIVMARATSMNMAIVGEVVSGIAFGVQAVLHAVMAEVLPRQWRPYAQATATVAAGLGGLVGLLVGGAMTQNNNYEGFRNYSYTTAGLYFVATVLCFFLYNPPVRKSQLGLTNAQKLKQLDWIGYAFLALGLVGLCIGLSWSQNPYQWTNTHVLAPFFTGVGLITCLILYEARFKADGMCHHGLFSRGWNFNIALWCAVVDGIAFFAMNSYFTLEVSILYETNPLHSTLRYGIGFIVSTIMAVLAGTYCSTTKTIRLPTIFAFSVMTAFFACMATVTRGSSIAVWAYPVLFGIGLGCSLCAVLALSQLSTPKELLTIATGLIISIRSFGGSIGLAIYNAIFLAQFNDHLAPKISEAVLPLGLPNSSLPAMIAGLSSGNATALASIPGATDEIIAAGLVGLKEGYILGFRYVWVAAGGFTALAALSAIFIVDPTKEFNMSIDAPAEDYQDLFA